MGHRRPAATTAAFQRLSRAVRLLRKRGLSEEAIDDFIRKRILLDLAEESAKYLKPSEN